ncbi:aminotransferase class IV [Chryseobacterium sp. MP_3.2]|uniref:aminotransferase class IV n=1 Tax=Chryseobacterium sp. MP_3.2 TaxID=3071712 RepID=UPI002E08C000|nr:branched-subunit amino acid aminotransferase/4-amino-4-deoxychorismate lyase [Chryseobacterium sp. MP_3.2]
MGTQRFTSENSPLVNRAFLFGDAVKVSFFVRNGQLILAEECYFFLMASMRKLRLQIPLSYTLEYFVNYFRENILSKEISNATIQLMVYRNSEETALEKAGVSFYYDIEVTEDVLEIRGEHQMDMIKEIHVNTHFLSTIKVHSVENIYAEIYARDNDLDDVILLNSNKKIARSIYGNLLFLEGKTIKIPKQSEGAYISPLMENFVTFLHKSNLAVIVESEMIAFESQKAEEIIMISDEKGIFSVTKIRNKTFETTRFTELIEKWKLSFN